MDISSSASNQPPESGKATSTSPHVASKTSGDESTPNDPSSQLTKEYTFNDLPDEIILDILNLLAQPNTSSTQFGDLPYHDFLDASVINKRVYRISYDPSTPRCLTIKNAADGPLEKFTHRDWVRKVRIARRNVRLADVAKAFPNIVSLDLHNQRQIPESEIIDYITLKGSQLNSLNLSGCNQVTKSLMKVIGKHCWNSLEQLSLRDTSADAVEGLWYLVTAGEEVPFPSDVPSTSKTVAEN